MSLKDFSEKYASYNQAVKNIFCDQKDHQNPYGIDTNLFQDLENALKNLESLEEKEVLNVVKEYSCLKQPEKHTKAVFPEQVDSVLHFELYEDFLIYHVGDGKPENEEDSDLEGFNFSTISYSLGQNRDKQNENTNAIFEEFGSENLKGVTGKDITWWTWTEGLNEVNYDKDPIILSKNLGLSEKKIKLLSKKSACLVEIKIDKNAFETKHDCCFFRPTGLESFEKNTKFRPNRKKDECYGRTINPEDQPILPEVVNRSIAYLELDSQKISITNIYTHERNI